MWVEPEAAQEYNRKEGGNWGGWILPSFKNKSDNNKERESLDVQWCILGHKISWLFVRLIRGGCGGRGGMGVVVVVGRGGVGVVVVGGGVHL